MQFLPFVAFFLSGASSLIFQSIWTRMLHHVFGSTSVAMSTVLSIFMAGLGLGAWLFGKYSNRIKQPLVAYAIAELCVGICGLVIPLLVSPEGWLGSMNAWMRAAFGTGSMGFALARFIAIIPVLIVPTTLMGSTLPLLAKHFVDAEEKAGIASSRVGTLYALNTLGAVAGTFFSGFLLMPRIGLAATNYTAVGLNIALAAAIFGLRKWLRAPKSESAETTTEDISADLEPEEVESRPATPLAKKLAVIAFGASGAAALCYEVVWTRALANVIGSSIYSFTLILMTFLIGIAGGSAFISSVLRSARRGLVGTGAVAVVLIFIANAPTMMLRHASLAGYVSSVAIGIAILTVISVVAAIRFRGATSAMRRPSHRETTGWAIALLLVPIGSSAVYLMTVHEMVAKAKQASGALFQGLGVPEYLPWIVFSVIGSISLFLIASIALRRSHVLLLGIFQLLIAGSTFLNYIWADEVPLAFAGLVASLQKTITADTGLAGHIGTVQFLMFFTASLCILPATLGMGAMFPLTMRVFSSGGTNIGKDVGVVYTSNTIGSILGAWLPGFVLFPLIGMERTLHLGIAINLVLALMMLVGTAAEDDEESESGERSTAETALVYLLACMIPALGALGYLGTAHSNSALRWDLSRMTLGVFRVSLDRDVLNPEDWGSPDLVYYHDGLSTTVSVERWGRHYALKNNGKVDASNGEDMPTQVLVSAYPLLMHKRGPDGLDVAIVGFGSGVTVGTTLKFPVNSVRVIELERSIPEAARFFADVNFLNYKYDHFPYVEMPRLEVINDDGRNYLASTQQKFDVIMSEPSNPWITGVSDLFTIDHFRIAKKRLKTDGIYCQWVQLYELSPENIKTIFRTFASEFKYVIVLAADDMSSDTVVLGSDSPLPLDLAHLQALYARPEIAEQLERAKIHSPFDIFSRVLLSSRDEVMRYTQIEEHRASATGWVEDPAAHNDAPCDGQTCRRISAVLNTDDNARIEFAAPRDLIGYQRYEKYLSSVYSAEWPYGHLANAVIDFGSGNVAARNYAELALALIASGRRTEAAQFIEHSHDAGEAKEQVIAVQVISYLLSRDREPRITIEAPTPGAELDRRAAERLLRGFEETKSDVDSQAFSAALSTFEEIPAPLRDHSGPSMKFLDGYLHYKIASAGNPRFNDAITALEDLVRTAPRYVDTHLEVLYFLAKSYDGNFDFALATRTMREYVERKFEATIAAQTPSSAALPQQPATAP